MPKQQQPFINLVKFIPFILLLCQLPALSQTPANAIIKQQSIMRMNGLNGSGNAFIKNIGQYGDTMSAHGKMGNIKYGYEGNDMLVLFTPKGLMHLHRKIIKPSEQEEKELERKGIPEEEIEKRVSVTDKIISMEWEGANPEPEIIAEEETTDYHTYGLLQDKAYGYKKITYKNLYPGIDIIYHFTNTDKTGFEYSIVLQPGASLGLVKMKYGGDTKNIQVDGAGNLVINSGINGVVESGLAAFSSTDDMVKLSVDKVHPQQLYNISYQSQNKLISFVVPGYDKTKTLVIDPFVSNTNSLTGVNSGIAKDIDFDYAGNIYVAGGGSVSGACLLAKYDPSGALLWTFSGTLSTPSWIFGTAYGGWVVEKGSGKTLLGQGLNSGGTRIIRLSAAGVYDNYITNIDPAFWENWKFLWSCNNGNPQILIAGGGITSNVNLAVCSPPVTTLASINLTGISTFGQDIVDLVVDPLTNDMYTIFASSFLTPFVNNRMYKNTQPYNAAGIAWQVLSGYTTMSEARNRPYLNPVAGNTDNSMNALAVNSSYLYYWDGLNLKAFNKTDGSSAGMPLTIPGNTAKMQGGIIADECNNIFIGNINGTIKVYKFDGVNFNDAAAADISIPGFPLAAVYDLAYDEARRLLYASGAGFVAAFDISAYCVSNVFNLTVTLDCPALSVQANISPAPPVGTTLTFALFVGTTQVASNATGLFTGLATGTNYTIKAFLNQACSGVQLIQDFTLNTCFTLISATFINPSCNIANGTITASAMFGTPPYQFSKDGVTFQANGIFTGLAAGNYAIIVKDAANFRDTIDIILVNSLPLQLTAPSVPSSCNQYDGIINATASGGTPPLNYSLFTGLAPGNYTITVKDTNNCTVSIPVFVDSLNTVLVNAGNNVTICEGDKTTLAGVSNVSSFLWTPSTGLSNPNILTPDASPVITTMYTLTGQTGFCKSTSSVTVFVNPAPVANAGRDTGICSGKNAQLNGTGGGSYSWSPDTYLSAANIANPLVLQPKDGSITYRLSLIGNNGCASLKDDAVTITVSPPAKLFVGYDTIIAVNQPLPLHGIDVNNTGFNNYTWSPPYGLNNPFAKDPVAKLDRDMLYNVIASNAWGCSATDDIKIKVFEGPEIYVPNAFTPGGDGLNDKLRPVVIGMKEFHYFSVFNRYGQMLFTTADAAIGWDGNFKGTKQPPGTYVWMAEAVDYRGNLIQRNGAVILIR
ncbi:MAG: gliding motility-associated C-terminal domain-containing protein [Chitinophagaceae bacterium]|nr:gliding motility-associated C-terminal domain-containing protein [Chitinophagaceae bacterium]